MNHRLIMSRRGSRLPLLAALSLLAALPFPSHAGPTAGTPPKARYFDLNQTVGLLGYEGLDENMVKVAPTVPTINTDRTVNKRLADLNFFEMADQKVVNAVPTPPKKQYYYNFAPAVSGATGLIEIPSAYTIPCKDLTLTYMHEFFDAGPRFWPLPYQEISQSNDYFVLNYGVADTLEFHLSFENWDREFQYLDGFGGLGPFFESTDKFKLGFGTKWGVPIPTVHETAWLAFGLRSQFYDNEERSFIEFHEYERIQNLYVAFSVHPHREVFAHFLYRYVTYDFRGGTFPSGRTETFVGFQPVVDYSQFGLGFQYYLFPQLELISELTKDTDIVFLGGLKDFNLNAGFRVQYKGIAAGFLAKRVNHPDLRHQLLQLSVKF